MNYYKSLLIRNYKKGNITYKNYFCRALSCNQNCVTDKQSTRINNRGSMKQISPNELQACVIYAEFMK